MGSKENSPVREIGGSSNKEEDENQDISGLNNKIRYITIPYKQDSL